MSIADALYKLEASKDIPTIKLVPFSGSPLQYVKFVEFRIHIHDKPHLKDDTRMVQLRMHVTGDAECKRSSKIVRCLPDHLGSPTIRRRIDGRYQTCLLTVASCFIPNRQLKHSTRVVFDPAFNIRASLNSFLCKGPCLIGNLLGVVHISVKTLLVLLGLLQNVSTDPST